MPDWTKADIDELVAGNTCVQYFSDNLREEVRRDFYLAAGLTAFGAPKPEKVRCWIHDTHGRKYFHVGEPDHTPYVDGTDGSKCSIIPGTFVPDGAE